MTPAEQLLLADLELVEFFRESARQAGGSVVEGDGLVFAAGATGFPVAANVAVRVDAAVPDRAVIERADAFFGERGRGYTLVVREHSEPSLRKVAARAGLREFDPGPWLVLDEPPPGGAPGEGTAVTGTMMERVTDRAGVERFATVMADAYASLGMPPGEARRALPAGAWLAPHLLLFLAVAAEGDEPLAGALCHLSHGIAGIYWVGTVQGARGRGLGEAVTAAAVSAGFGAGARFASLQASSMGDPVYRRMGFREIGAHRWMVRFTPPEQRRRS